MAEGSAEPDRRRVYLVLAAALVAVSFAAVFIRLANAPAPVVALYRLAIASLILAPSTLRALRRTPLKGRAAWLTALSGLALAIHFATWISSLSFTTIAASVTLATTTPLWTALFAWLVLGAAPTLSVLLGMTVAVAGAAVIGFGDLVGGTNPVLGDLLALAAAACAAVYFLIGREVMRGGVSLPAYVGAVYGWAALWLLPLPLIAGVPYLGYSWEALGWIALLALVPQVVGHTGLNYTARHLGATVTATAVLAEPIGSGVLAALVFGEVPPPMTLVGAVLVLGGVTLVVRTGEPRGRGRAGTGTKTA
ncbi:MAG TPA: DMT family transporter [Trueperaceae bacterium]